MIFLVNIIRILVIKLRTTNSTNEPSQYRCVLFFLLFFSVVEGRGGRVARHLVAQKQNFNEYLIIVRDHVYFFTEFWILYLDSFLFGSFRSCSLGLIAKSRMFSFSKITLRSRSCLHLIISFLKNVFYTGDVMDSSLRKNKEIIVKKREKFLDTFSLC